MTVATMEQGATPPVVHNPEKSDRVVVHLSKPMSQAVAAFQRRRMLPNRAEAIRQLLSLALETDKAEQEREPRK